MKRLFYLLAFTLLFTTTSFAETKTIVTGQSIIYSPIGERHKSSMILSKVIPAGGGYYYVDFVVEVSPAQSAVGFSTYSISYYLKKGDKIILSLDSPFGSIPSNIKIVELGSNCIIYEDEVK